MKLTSQGENPLLLPRRSFLMRSAGLVGATAMPVPAWAKGISMGEAAKGFGTLSGEDIRLDIQRSHYSTGNRSGHAVTVNGSVPGPLIRLREG